MRIPVCLMALAVLAGCGKQPEAPKPAAAAPGPALVTVTGTVLETMDAAEYTYLRLKTATGETWAAVSKSKVATGDTVTVTNAMMMEGFKSNTLNRTFDKILFGVLAAPGGAATAPGAPAPPTREQMAAQHGQAAGGPDDTPDVKVPKAEGANAKTVAEVWAQRAELKGKDVVVRAKVVKVTSGVLDRNWLHVRDGSGSKATKDNDLTVTTEGAAKIGDVVTVTGAVSVDKDFGAGYAYPVIIESAKIAP
jgi:hypothetical protein